MTHKLTTNYTENYCNRTLIVKVIIENVVTCFLGHSVDIARVKNFGLWGPSLSEIGWVEHALSCGSTFNSFE